MVKSKKLINKVNMSKKHFCKHCKKEIEEGKEVKIERGRK